MKKTELILGALSTLGIMMKFLLIPGHSLLIVFPMCILSLIYFFLGFALFNDIPLLKVFNKDYYKEVPPSRLIGTIGLGFCFSEILFGALFKIQNYPGGALQMITGLFFVTVILIVSAIRTKKEKSNFYQGIFSRIAIIGLFGLAVLLTPKDWLMRVTHRDNPAYLEQMNLQ